MCIDDGDGEGTHGGWLGEVGEEEEDDVVTVLEVGEGMGLDVNVGTGTDDFASAGRRTDTSSLFAEGGLSSTDSSNVLPHPALLLIRSNKLSPSSFPSAVLCFTDLRDSTSSPNSFFSVKPETFSSAHDHLFSRTDLSSASCCGSSGDLFSFNP